MKEGVKLDVIIDRFFYEGNSQVARSRNAISRLWWTAYLTVQKNVVDEDEKWKYTKLIFSNQDLQVSLLERKLGLYENVRFGFLDYFEVNRNQINSKRVQEIIRNLNNLGGAVSISSLDKNEIITILNNLTLT